MKSVKRFLKNDAPAWVKKLFYAAYSFVAIRSEYRADRRRYSRYSAPDDWAATPDMSERNLEAQLTKDYHRVEKGLALAEPKRPFGATVLERLDTLIPSARPVDHRQHAETAQKALVDWNNSGIKSDVVSPLADIRAGSLADPEEFFNSRHSVRDFSDSPVSQEDLDRATRLAIRTPSVCNRQSWIIRYYTNREDIRRALKYQNGNAGMDVVPALALITVDSRLFTGPTERNQGYIEGGLFSMTLGWSLHSIGLDSVMLNLSISQQQMKRLRSSLGIPEYELLIMMTAIGQARPNHRIARSPRRRLEEIVASPRP